MAASALTAIVFCPQPYWVRTYPLAVPKLPPESTALSMQSGAIVFSGIDLNHASHLAAIFRGNSGGEDRKSESTSSASISGPELGDRLSVRGTPSTTNCT